jgi:glycerophosphoryl diester phosphodiesterase
MAAFGAAQEMGADAIEFDVHLTRDGVPVVIHDYDLARTTSGTGYVFELNAHYVRSLDAGSWFDPSFAGERVPLLEEVLALDGIGFELEIKGLPTSRLVDAVVSEVRNAGVESRIEFTGNHTVAMPRLRMEFPAARLGLFPQVFAGWMTPHLYQEILIETAKTGSYDVVHVLPITLMALTRHRFAEAGLRLHSADPSTPEELGITLDRADQFTVSDVKWAMGVRDLERCR